MKTHDEFVRLLNNSNEIVKIVASYFEQMGYNTSIPESTLSIDEKPGKDFKDLGDILLTFRVEAKQKLLEDFDSVESYPFPSVFIDESYKVDNKHINTLFGYAIMNKSGTGFIFVPMNTRKYWYKTKKFDRREKQHREFYAVDKKYTFYISGAGKWL